MTSLSKAMKMINWSKRNRIFSTDGMIETLIDGHMNLIEYKVWHDNSVAV